MRTQRSLHDHLLKLVALLTLGFGVALLLHNLFLWLHFRVHIPVTDQAYILPLVQSVVENGFFSVSINEWISPASGAHRIAVTRLLMSFDYLFLDGQNYLLYFATWASILILLLVMLNAFKKSFWPEKTLIVFVAGITLAFLSSRSQLWNVVNPINSSWYITFAAGALSFTCITSIATPPSLWRFAIAYLMAVIASFSTFAGVIVWLILPIFIAIRSLSAGAVAALISTLYIALYLSGISTDTDQFSGELASELAKHLPSEPISLVDQTLHLVGAVFKNTLVFLGSPLSITHPLMANCLVVASLVILSISWLALLVSWRAGRQSLNAWMQLNLAIATLCLGTATAANMGRVILSTPAADRYQTVVMMYWLGICGLILGFGVVRCREKPLRLLGYMMLCVTVPIVFLANPSFPITTSAKLSEAANRASVLDAFGVPGKYLYLSAWRSGYLNDFHTFFEINKLAHRASEVPQIPIGDSIIECPNVQLSIAPTKWPGVVFASARVEDLWVNWHRKLPISTAQGDVLGYLFPSFEGTRARGRERTTNQTTGFLRRTSIWTGYLDSTINSSERVHLHYRSFTQADLSCDLVVSWPSSITDRR